MLPNKGYLCYNCLYKYHMQSYKLIECSYSGDSYSGCLVGKPKIVTSEIMTRELTGQLLGGRDKRLGL